MFSTSSYNIAHSRRKVKKMLQFFNKSLTFPSQHTTLLIASPHDMLHPYLDTTQPDPKCPYLGQMITLFDDNLQLFVANVCAIDSVPSSTNSDRPDIAALGITEKGWRIAFRCLKPAYHNGTRWILKFRWCFMGEINPDDDPEIKMPRVNRSKGNAQPGPHRIKPIVKAYSQMDCF